MQAKHNTFSNYVFDSTLHLINGISIDLQKVFKHFNDTAIVAFLQIPFAPSATALSDNLALYLKDLKLSVFAISALKLVPLSLE